MGAICSKDGAHTGGHTVLESSSQPSSPTPARKGAKAAANPVNESDPRAAAAAAAERRAKESQTRGVAKGGAKQGTLAKKLAETNRAIDQRLPEQHAPERVVWD